MDDVLTLIADPARRDLDERRVGAVRSALDALGAETGTPDWLHPQVACDIPFDGLAPDQADAAARRALAGAPIDLIAQPTAGRRKRLLVADMESTIIRQEMLDEIGEVIGQRDRIAGITRRSMNGEVDFAEALRERIALFAGLEAAALENLTGRIEAMPGAAALVATMRAHGAFCVLVSGGFRAYTRHVREQVGFDEDHGNEAEVEGGRLTGRAVEPVLDAQGKLSVLLRVAGAHRVPIAETLAVGDGANDLAMLKAAGLGVAFHAKPVVAAESRTRVDHGDLTALLYAQGYRAEEIRE